MPHAAAQPCVSMRAMRSAHSRTMAVLTEHWGHIMAVVIDNGRCRCIQPRTADHRRSRACRSGGGGRRSRARDVGEHALLRQRPDEGRGTICLVAGGLAGPQVPAEARPQEQGVGRSSL
jgi:hypothetical protein